MKIVIIGSTHAGTAAIKSIKSHHPEAEIDVYEKNDNVSFLSCGIALSVQSKHKNTSTLDQATLRKSHCQYRSGFAHRLYSFFLSVSA